MTLTNDMCNDITNYLLMTQISYTKLIFMTSRKLPRVYIADITLCTCKLYFKNYLYLIKISLSRKYIKKPKSEVVASWWNNDQEYYKGRGS